MRKKYWKLDFEPQYLKKHHTSDKDVIAAVKHEQDKSTKLSKSDKKKAAMHNVKKIIIKEFHDVNPALPLFQELCDFQKIKHLWNLVTRQSGNNLNLRLQEQGRQHWLS